MNNSPPTLGWSINPRFAQINNRTNPRFARVSTSYVLRSVTNPNLMYCEMTNNLRRRLRQHNGCITGGGKYTSANRPWKLAALIPHLQDKSQALKVERNSGGARRHMSRRKRTSLPSVLFRTGLRQRTTRVKPVYPPTVP